MTEILYVILLLGSSSGLQYSKYETKELTAGSMKACRYLHFSASRFVFVH